MKTFIFILFGLFSFQFILAQSPNKFSYQAVLRDANNKLIDNQQVGIRVGILQGAPEGTIVYLETHVLTSNENGLISLEVGNGQAGSGYNLLNIDWSIGPFYLKTELDPTGGANYSITVTSQLLSVPFALYAETAERLKDDLIENQNLTDVLTKGNSAGNATISNLGDPINNQDATTKSYVDKLIKEIEYLKAISGIGTVTDINGNIYKTKTIGIQTWMIENLRTSNYNDGVQILNVKTNLIWDNLNSGAYCWYENDSAANELVYGKLYNWDAVSTGKLCPIGWHVPTDADWTVLVNQMGGVTLAGGQLKENGTAHWLNPNGGATNLSGFTALPGGFRGFDDKFWYQTIYGTWWSQTEYNSENAFYLLLSYTNGYTDMSPNTKIMGNSVRCLRN